MAVYSSVIDLIGETPMLDVVLHAAAGLREAEQTANAGHPFLAAHAGALPSADSRIRNTAST